MKSSPFIHKFKTRKYQYIYDVNTNHVVRVNEIVYDIIDYYGIMTLEDIIRKFGRTYDAEFIKQAYRSIQLAQQEGGLFSANRPERIKYPLDKHAIQAILDSELKQICLSVTEQCNLRCRYCIYGNSYPFRRNHRPRFMSFDTARKAIDYLLNHSTLKEEIFISFYGGEPLLCKELIKKCVHYAEDTGRTRTIRFNICTNGTLLDEAMIDFFIEHDFNITVSLDGPRFAHDSNRVFIDGTGTYDIVTHNLKKIHEKDPNYYAHNVSFNMVISPPFPVQVYDDFVCSSDLIEVGHYINLLKPLFKDTDYYTQFDSQDVNKGYDKLWEKYQQAAIKGLLNVTPSPKELLFVRAHYDPVMIKLCKRLLGRNIPSSYHPGGICIPGARRIFVTVDGRFFPCEKVNENVDQFCIGTCTTGVDVRKVLNLIDLYTTLNDNACATCWALRFCGICFAHCDRNGKLDPKGKFEACEAYRRAMHEALIRCYSILEENPNAFRFTQNIEYFE